jgi:glycosyltransferase involved in cell wall biosynthesis
MNYIIFGETFTFPEGSAATNRVHTYAKGFYENGIRVHVICFGNNYNMVAEGTINGINYYNPFGQKKRSNYFVIRRWQKLIKYYKTLALIRKINKNNKIVVIISYTQFLLTQFFAFFLAKYVKSHLIIERGEHPLRFKGSFLSKIQGEIKPYMDRVLCDGIFCISQYLIDFYNNRGVNEKKLLLVPSTVDTERFNYSYNSPLGYQYIVYCGALTLLKDGVNILVESFARISEKFPEINLVLIGKGDSENEETVIKDLIARLSIDKRVFLLGQLSRNEVPAYLTNAKILALARPKSMIADAGFPSKLTEYLATGIPVVATEVGDIPFYLKDNENAFLSKPDSVDAFAEKLDFVLSNYKYAKDIAKKGKELTNSKFNYKYQAKRIIEFVNAI